MKGNGVVESKTHIRMISENKWERRVGGCTKPVLCDEGWDGVGGGRKFQEGGDTCISTADSC